MNENLILVEHKVFRGRSYALLINENNDPEDRYLLVKGYDPETGKWEKTIGFRGSIVEAANTFEQLTTKYWDWKNTKDEFEAANGRYFRWLGKSSLVSQIRREIRDVKDPDVIKMIVYQFWKETESRFKDADRRLGEAKAALEVMDEDDE